MSRSPTERREESLEASSPVSGARVTRTGVGDPMVAAIDQSADSVSLPTALEGVSSGASIASERARYKTTPGGGRNRTSGGRVAAIAYVSPKTVSPAQGVRQETVPVRVHTSVIKDAHSYKTEPSLLRRRASSLPPPHSSRNAVLFALGLMGSLACGALAIWFSERGAAPESATLPVDLSTSNAEVLRQEARNDGFSRPNEDRRAGTSSETLPVSLPADPESPADVPSASDPTDPSVSAPKELAALPPPARGPEIPRVVVPSGVESRGSAREERSEGDELASPSASPGGDEANAKRDLWLE